MDSKVSVLIPTIGSRGDVQPYINLAVELQKANFAITIATHPYWRETVESFHIGFAPLGPDVNFDVEVARVRREFNILAVLKLLNSVHQMASSQLLEIAKPFDLLLVSHTLCGALEAQKLNKPYISATLEPSTIPEVTPGKNRLGKVLRALLHSFYFNAGPWGRTKRRYGLKGVTRFSHLLSPELNLIPISRHICPQGVRWAKNHVVTGIWQLPPMDQALPDSLGRFLEKYGSPVIVALGAMSFDTGHDVALLQTMINAISKSGNAGIIQGFASSIEKIDLPENILPLCPFPHNTLFKHGKLIIHHCGFGTMTTALYAGRPSIPIPHILDQPFWANRLFELNLCPEPIPARKLSEERLLSAIDACTSDREIVKNTANMMENLRGKNGLREARSLIENFCQNAL